MSKRNTASRDAFLNALQIARDENVHLDGTPRFQLCDTVPPVEPPPAVKTDPNVKPHTLRAWRHDGGMNSFPFYSLQAAREHADALCHLIYWKWAIVCGREIVARGAIEESVS